MLFGSQNNRAAVTGKDSKGLPSESSKLWFEIFEFSY